MAPWCNRCKRSFKSPSSYNQHIRHSSRHWQCPAQCGEDCPTMDDLLQHCRDYGCCHVCQGCNDGCGDWFLDGDEYWDHMDDCNVCTICERHFGSANNLFHHNLSHRKLDYECLRCDKGFKTYGGMIIHLESGCCSDVNSDKLNAIAAECNSCDEFVFENYQRDMIDGDLKYYHGQVLPYFCPTCDVTLAKLSSQFQHAESQSCSQTLDDGAIRDLREHLAYYV